MECALAEVRNTVAAAMGVVVQAQTIHGDVVMSTRTDDPPVTAVVSGLPISFPHFVGRCAELAELDRSLDKDGLGVIVIDGMAGVGKTTLAVQWANHVRHRFPDGVLHLDLRGFAPISAQVSPMSALRALCRSLGVDADDLDDDQPLADQILEARYRTAMRERRCLILLDNARSGEQVLPLVPGDSPSVVLVTSRNRLDSMVVRMAATRVGLGTLHTAESRDLLARYLGRARVESEPDAVERIVGTCSNLPLALSIIAARGHAEPGLQLAGLASELQDEYDGFDALDTGDPETSLRAAFALSYGALDDAAAHLFGMIGLHPGRDIGLGAATALAGKPVKDTRAAVKQLVRANLLTESQGRYTCHNLLKSYAAELASPSDGLTRCLGYYLDTAISARRVLTPRRPQLSTDMPRRVAPHVSDAHGAMRWFRANYANLLAAYGHARKHGDYDYTWRMLWALMIVLELGDWHGWHAAHFADD